MPPHSPPLYMNCQDVPSWQNVFFKFNRFSILNLGIESVTSPLCRRILEKSSARPSLDMCSSNSDKFCGMRMVIVRLFAAYGMVQRVRSSDMLAPNAPFALTRMKSVSFWALNLARNVSQAGKGNFHWPLNRIVETMTSRVRASKSLSFTKFSIRPSVFSATQPLILSAAFIESPKSTFPADIWRKTRVDSLLKSGLIWKPDPRNSRAATWIWGGHFQTIFNINGGHFSQHN